MYTRLGFPWTRTGLGNVVLHEGCKSTLVHDEWCRTVTLVTEFSINTSQPLKILITLHQSATRKFLSGKQENAYIVRNSLSSTFIENYVKHLLNSWVYIRLPYSTSSFILILAISFVVKTLVHYDWMIIIQRHWDQRNPFMSPNLDFWPEG